MDLVGHVAALAALCRELPAGPATPIALFVAGLAGSAGHCLPMCGPIVLAQAAGRLERVPVARLCELTRLRAGLLLPYHAGRIATYAALGAGLAEAGSDLGRLLNLERLSGIFLIAAAALLLGQTLGRALPEGAPWSAALARLAARIDRGTMAGGFLLGLTLGFLPCGLLYAALAAAAAAGDPARGAVAMACFGLGTVPSLVATAIAGHAALRRWPHAATAIGRALTGMSGVALAVAGIARLV